MRGLVQLVVPVVAVLVFIPTSFPIRVLTAIAAAGPAMMISIGYLIETTENRLIKAGYPAGYGELVRKERAAKSQYEESLRKRARRERIAARRYRV